MEGSIERASKPDWLKVRMVPGPGLKKVRETLRARNVRTVCDSSRCPNLGDCWGSGTATFMILGGVCTRACRFCAVPCGDPLGVVDLDEPERVALSVADLGLRHAVITSVTRDDLVDGGASLYAATVREIRRSSPTTTIELLIPDMGGEVGALRTVASSRPDVIGHNLEVVSSLQPSIRGQKAGYSRSLQVLGHLKSLAPAIWTKTSLMLGLGETHGEVLQALKDARERGVDLLALGQYLRPKGGSLPVSRYVPPQEFAELRQEALDLGFRRVMAGPLVRSSYHAHDMLSEEDEDRC
ncbi:MAG: lipoyl synthase [Methanomassiliicoccales archaeon]|nr:lipoyl synthase [Methanomassiliicoccales archaeon]MDD1755723.1 lipoyl synthase [Methanomassiliicoccales archaeon]